MLSSNYMYNVYLSLKYTEVAYFVNLNCASSLCLMKEWTLLKARTEVRVPMSQTLL